MFWMGSRFCKIFYDFQFKHQSWGNSFGLEGNAMPTQKLWLKQVLLTWMVRDEILAKCITAEVGSFTALSTLFCKTAVGIQFTTSFAREPWSFSWKRSALRLLGFLQSSQISVCQWIERFQGRDGPALRSISCHWFLCNTLIDFDGSSARGSMSGYGPLHLDVKVF